MRMMRWKGMLWAAVGIIVGVLLEFSGGTVWAAEARSQTEDVDKFVRSYYAAWTKDTIDDAMQMLSDAPPYYRAYMEALIDNGFQKYDNLDIRIYPLKEQGSWLTAIGYDVIFENIEWPLPGATAMLVKMKEDGSLILVDDLDSLLESEVAQLMEGEEIVALYNEKNSEYNEICWEHPEVLEWLQNLVQEIDKQAAKDSYQEVLTEAIYIVQKGDCLWHIAASKLGDGTQWVELYDANKDVIGDDPNIILIGMELHIP